ncbi:hypothetical protein [Clostridium sp.]|jgi:hypothetical protein|uniref:hypothetical protein n=1 Tax=Clostridium sp. TaxID=1506 RepID=UPI0028512131|nr:hypothetical protein [Clostridium sp.]MDR3596389.1 hypothetical protein [Clostridium sp.]
MSRRKCCCKKEHEECCCQPANSGFLGGGCTPIIFLLIACGSGLLNCNKSYLIILLFLLCGGCNFLGGNCEGSGSCC